jgi:ERCC4-related helicase
MQKTETVFGGASKNLASQIETSKRFKQRETISVIATSVLEEGASPAEADVIQHSLPITTIARRQRAGRTARTRPGNVIYIVLKHPLDTTRYWKTWWGVKNMQRLVEQGFVSAEEIATEKKRIRKGKTPKAQLPLDFDPF